MNDVWYRGIIKFIIHEGSFVVFLIDYGHTVYAKMQNIKMLSEYHATISPFVFKSKLCVLKDDIFIDKSDELIIKFAKIEKMLVYQNEFDVLLITDNTTEKCKTVYFLHEKFGVLIRQELRISIPLHSEWLDQISEGNSKMIKGSLHTIKSHIKLSHIQSPSAIFVKTHSDMNLSQNLRNEINAYITNEKLKNGVSNAINWDVADQCLVQYQKPKTEKIWCRGRIAKVPDDGHLSVFLRDFGTTIKVSSHELMLITEELASHPDCVQKCHLDVSQEWSPKSKEFLHQLVSEYTNFAISYGTSNETSSGVTLWATNSELADASNIEIWDNIGLRLISEEIKDSVDWCIEKEMYRNERNQLKNNGSDEEYKSDTSTELKHAKMMSLLYKEWMEDDEKAKRSSSFPILPDPEHEWPAALPLQANVYRGIVTNISASGVIDFMEENNFAAASEMCTGIKKAIENQLYDENTKWKWNWTIGDACFAKYAIDEEFYRANIIDFNPDKGLYKVILKNQCI